MMTSNIFWDNYNTYLLDSFCLSLERSLWSIDLLPDVLFPNLSSMWPNLCSRKLSCLVSIRSFSEPFKRFSVTIGKLFSSVHDFISRDKSRRLPTYAGERNLLSAFNFKYIPMLYDPQLSWKIKSVPSPLGTSFLTDLAPFEVPRNPANSYNNYDHDNGNSNDDDKCV